MCDTNARKRRRDDAEIRSQIENEQPFPSRHASEHSSENVSNADSNKRASLDTNTGEEGSTREDKNELPRANMKKPPRPMSAYNMFFRDERAKILAAATDADNGAESSREGEGDQKSSSGNSSNEGSKARRRPHGVISFGQLGKTIAARWKTIDADTLAKYNKLAAREKELYREKVQEYFKNQDAILEQYRETCTANPADTATGEGTVSSDVSASSRGGLGTSAVATSNEEAEAYGRNRLWSDARPLRLDSEGVASLSTLAARAREASTQYVAADDVRFRAGVPAVHPANNIEDAIISSVNRHTAVGVPFGVQVPTVQPANIIDNTGIPRASRYMLRDHGYHAYDGILGHDQMINYSYPFIGPRFYSVTPQLSAAAAASPMHFSATRNHAQYPLENLYHPLSNPTGLNYGILQSNAASGGIANRSNYDVYLQRPAAERYDPNLLHYRYVPHLTGHANSFSPDATSLLGYISELRPNVAVSQQQAPVIRQGEDAHTSPSATETDDPFRPRSGDFPERN